MKKLIIILPLVFFIGFDASAQWNVRHIASQPGGKAMDIEMADGRNDGVQRIYVSSSAGNIYEWSYNGGNWSSTLVTNGKDKKSTFALLEAMNFPFIKNTNKKVTN